VQTTQVGQGIEMSAAMMEGASSSKGGGGAPGGLSAKQQKLFELRMRMVLCPLPQAAVSRVACPVCEGPGAFVEPLHAASTARGRAIQRGCMGHGCMGDRLLSVRTESGDTGTAALDRPVLTCEFLPCSVGDCVLFCVAYRTRGGR
jgi:hypothetical protein